VLAATGVVVTVKVAPVAPLGTVTEAGTCATAVLPLERVTLTPLVGAAAVKVTVPVELVPPVTPVGLSVMDETAGPAGVIVSWPLLVVP
jgi:hypothetical protein